MKKVFGLTPKQVEENRKKYGSNKLPDVEPKTFWSEFKDGLGDPMIRILLVIAAIMFGMFAFGQSTLYEPIGTVIAVLVANTITASAAVSNDTEYRKLKQRTEVEYCAVVREGEVTVVNVDDIVVGDVVIVSAGGKIPADGVLIDGNIKVNNVALNGETEECPKTATSEDSDLPAQIDGDTFVDAHSLFRGATVYDGEGLMLVKRVGIGTDSYPGTMMGKMAQEMQGEEPDSPLKIKLNKLAHQISVFGYVGAIAIAVFYTAGSIISAGGISAYLSEGTAYIVKNLLETLGIAIGIVVCAVPEGLPTTIALVLMLNTSTMLKHNVLVREAIGIETSGSINILMSDKTGTITKGILEVVSFFTGDGKESCGTPQEGKGLPNSSEAVKNLVETGIACNTGAMFDKEHNVIGGNATDQALLRWLGYDTFVNATKANTPTNSQSFNSANKFSQAEVAGRTFYKGAPERLLEHATKYIDIDGNIKDIDIEALNKKIDDQANMAMRVLAFGYSEKPMKPDAINDDLILIGLVGIRDDIRPEAVESIKETQTAGIQVVMITGDRLETAVAIAKDAGLLDHHSTILTEENKSDLLEKYKNAKTSTSTEGIAISSNMLGKLSDEEVKTLVSGIRVIARALPTDKSRMVRLCQEMNLVVGMTGDGVNDSPALKQADVGFAMGKSGTEAAKDASKIVIMDDNFRSIKDAIWYGRTVYHNILKFCKFQLAINFAAVIVNCIFPFLGVGQPLTVTHLLFVNLVMDALGSLLISGEPAKPEYMLEKPKRRDESIISKPMAIQVGVAALWMVFLSVVFLKVPWFSTLFSTHEQHLTGYFALFIWTAMMNAWNIRDEKFNIFSRLKENTNFIKIMIAILVVQFAIINAAMIPFGKTIGEMFKCTPFGLKGWVAVIIMSMTIVPIDMIRKAVVGAKK